MSVSLPALVRKKQIFGRPGRAFFAKQSFKKIASAEKRPRKDTGWYSIAKVLLLLFFIGSVLIFPSVSFAKKRSSSGRMSCQSAILSDSTQAKRLFGKNVHQKVLPASTTKVMTAILVLEKLSLDQYVRVGPRALNVQPTKLGLSVGEEYRVRDLLLAILLKSANDASIVLAEAVAGSEGNFVQLMNQRARKLGAKNTKFANSNGLPTKRGTQFTTAFDMFLIFREALKFPFFDNAIKRRFAVIYSKAGRKLALKSHNKILFSDWKKKVYGKTGYTRSAQACFVGTIEKDNHTLIVGVFGCQNRWDYIKYLVSRYGGIRL